MGQAARESRCRWLASSEMEFGFAVGCYIPATSAVAPACMAVQLVCMLAALLVSLSEHKTACRLFMHAGRRLYGIG